MDESIKTTLEKAKAIKGDVDKIVNKAKKGNDILKTQLLQRHLGIEALKKVIKDIAPRFKDRNSGYVKMVKLGRRFSDNADMVLMEWSVKTEIKNDIKELAAGKVEEKPKLTKATKTVRKENTKRKAVKK